MRHKIKRRHKVERRHGLGSIQLTRNGSQLNVANAVRAQKVSSEVVLLALTQSHVKPAACVSLQFVALNFELSASKWMTVQQLEAHDALGVVALPRNLHPQPRTYSRKPRKRGRDIGAI